MADGTRIGSWSPPNDGGPSPKTSIRRFVTFHVPARRGHARGTHAPKATFGRAQRKKKGGLLISVAVRPSAFFFTFQTSLFAFALALALSPRQTHFLLPPPYAQLQGETRRSTLAGSLFPEDSVPGTSSSSGSIANPPTPLPGTGANISFVLRDARSHAHPRLVKRPRSQLFLCVCVCVRVLGFPRLVLHPSHPHCRRPFFFTTHPREKRNTPCPRATSSRRCQSWPSRTRWTRSTSPRRFTSEFRER